MFFCFSQSPQKAANFHGTKHQAAYSHDGWFREQLYRFVFYRKHEVAIKDLYSECEFFLSGTNCTWNKKKLKNEFYRKIQKAVTDKTFTPPKYEINNATKQKEIAHEIAQLLLYKNNEESLTNILNVISKNKNLNEKLSQFPIGEQIITINEIARVLRAIRQYSSHSDLKLKENLLAALCCLNPDNSIANPHIIKTLSPKSFKRQKYSKIKTLKKRFNGGETRSLCNNIKNVRLIYPIELFQWALDFWLEMTHPNPNTKKTRVLTDKNKNKFIHPQHICYVSFDTVYDDWKSHETTQLICDKYNKPIPSKQWFFNIRPIFIYPVDDTDFSHCSVHHNWDNISKVMKQIITSPKYHHCGTKQCPNNIAKQEKCECHVCSQCPILNGLFKLSPTKFIKKISCKNNHPLYPDSKCFRSECDNINCGAEYLQKVIGGNFCAALNVSNDKLFKYNYHKKYRNPISDNSDDGLHKLTVNWTDLKANYLTEYRTFSKHHIAYIYNHRTRRDWIDKTQTNIPPNTAQTHFDYINNIKLQSMIKTAGQWSNRDGISLCCTVNRFAVSDEESTSHTKEVSFSYFSADPHHDWAAALYVVEEHIKNMQKYFKNELKSELHNFYGYSDRGEFSCSAFIIGLGFIKQRLNLKHLFWTFTCPQHGKSLCDSEGSTIKCEVNRGVNAGDIWYDPLFETYDMTIIRFLHSKLFAEHIESRKFLPIGSNVINHIHQDVVCSPIKDINDYFEYYIVSPTLIYRRYLDCKCIHCIDITSKKHWIKCENKSVCGLWKRCPSNRILIDKAVWRMTEN